MNNLGLMAIESGESIALRGVDVSVRIAGLLAETTLTQRYQNDGGDNLELTYTFPLPVDHVLLSFTVQLGERCYQGEVISRQKAEVAYEGTIASGNAAFRLQDIGDGLCNATLGNVLAGESVAITLHYAQVLAWNGRSVRYRLPTTLAPRYGAPTDMQPWQRPLTCITAEYPLSLRVRIDDPLAKSAVACPSHKVTFKPEDDALSITLAPGASLDRDFVLEVESASVQSLGLTASARETHVALLTLLPPAIEPDTETARDIVIVLDCSGSMMGNSIALAKEGVQLSLGSLSPNERFAVMGFGTEFAHFDPALQPANRKNIDLARRFVDELGNLGGTELSQALDLALAYAGGRPMDILLLTDGQAWDLGQAIERAQAKGIRLFTVGIGSAVAEDTVRTLADRTGGACELVSPDEDMAARIFRHFNRMRQPPSTRLDIAWPAQPIWEQRSETGCFAGDAYTVVAAFAEPITVPVPVSFAFAGRAPVQLNVSLAPALSVADPLVRIAARRHLAALPAAEQAAWAVRYQLISGQADYLVTVERTADDKAPALPELQVVPHMLPAGWGGTSDVRFCISHGPAVTCSPHDVLAAVVRKGRSPEVHEAVGMQSPYVAFLQNLNAHANRKFFGSLPKTKKGLARLKLPEALNSLFDELVDTGYPESEVLRALYQALILHDGQQAVNGRLVKKAEALIGNRAVVDDLVTRFSALLNELRADRDSVFPLRRDRYDIPAFLKNQAD